MESTITIEGKQIGRGRALFPSWEMPLQDGSRSPVLRDLIARIVREEVTSFHERQERRRVVEAITAAQIAENAARGKVAMGGRDPGQSMDEDVAIAATLRAFQDGVFYVFVDDAQIERLESPVELKPGSRVTFLRLVALAGG